MDMTVTPATSHAALEHGDPATDSRALRRCLGQYPTGVTVITARCGERLAGMAVNSFASVSLEPPLVAWSIRRASRSVADFLGASHFAVNILDVSQADTARLFGAGDPERFARTPWQAGPSGAPLLDEALVHLECKLVQTHDGGDHIILIGAVERYARFDGTPLVYAQGQYAVALPLPVPTPAGADGADTLPAGHAGTAGTSFFKLLGIADRVMSQAFDAHRRALGLTPATARILARLHEGPCDAAGLEQATWLGQQTVVDALADLSERGEVLPCADRSYALSAAGSAKHAAISDRLARFQDEQLQGIAVADLAAARRVLQALQSR